MSRLTKRSYGNIIILWYFIIVDSYVFQRSRMFAWLSDMQSTPREYNSCESLSPKLGNACHTY